MATDNYLRVRRGRQSVEFFFDSTDPVRVAIARRNANEYGGLLSELSLAYINTLPRPRLNILARARGWDETEIKNHTDDGIRAALAAADVGVWSHGVEGLGDLRCIGGCEVCSPRQGISLEEETEE